MLTLADLVFPATADEFLAHFVAKTRWLTRTDAPRRAEPLLPWSEIDRLITTVSIPPEQLRVLVNHNVANPRMYLDSRTGRMRVDVLQDMAWEGATLVIDGISQLVPSIAELATGLERELGHSVNVNCYASFGEHSAFLAHYDDHDVVVVQVHGSKHWRGYGIDVPFPREGTHTSAMTAPLWEEVLGPGDVLYVPRGEVHSAVPVQRPSLHLTIGIIELTGVDLVTWLGTRAARSEIFRRNLARNAPPEQRAARQAELRNALHGLIDATSLTEYLADDDRRRPPRPAAAFDFEQRLAPRSMLVSALRRRVDLELDDPAERKVELGDRQLRLSALARRALQVLNDRDRVTFSTLATELDCDVQDQAFVAALRSLARNALIEIADPAI